LLPPLSNIEREVIMLTGGCYCGAIRYQTAGPALHQTMCHCTQCRGTTGAPCVAWFTVPATSFTVLSGEPARFRSSNHATRSFCQTCGTQLTFTDDASPQEVDVTTCSLDHPEEMPPRSHIFTASAVPWLPREDGLPQHLRSRTQA
jgi:hypothetical protein